MSEPQAAAKEEQVFTFGAVRQMDRLANAMNGSGGGWRVPSSTHSSAVWRPTYQIHKLLLPHSQRTPPQPGGGTGHHATNGVDVGGASQGEITLQIVDRNELKAFGQQACVVGVVQWRRVRRICSESR